MIRPVPVPAEGAEGIDAAPPDCPLDDAESELPVPPLDAGDDESNWAMAFRYEAVILLSTYGQKSYYLSLIPKVHPLGFSQVPPGS